MVIARLQGERDEALFQAVLNDPTLVDDAMNELTSPTDQPRRAHRPFAPARPWRTRRPSRTRRSSRTRRPSRTRRSSRTRRPSRTRRSTCRG